MGAAREAGGVANEGLLPQPPDSLNGIGGLPDLNDFLKDDLALAQFFASGIFDMQSSLEGFTSAF